MNVLEINPIHFQKIHFKKFLKKLTGFSYEANTLKMVRKE